MRMFISSALVEIIIYGSQSLKEKRQVIRSIVDLLSNRLNISIAEIGFLDKWQRAGLGIACVANNPVHAQKVVNSAIQYIEEDGRLEVINIEREVF